MSSRIDLRTTYFHTQFDHKWQIIHNYLFNCIKNSVQIILKYPRFVQLTILIKKFLI